MKKLIAMLGLLLVLPVAANTASAIRVVSPLPAHVGDTITFAISRSGDIAVFCWDGNRRVQEGYGMDSPDTNFVLTNYSANVLVGCSAQLIVHQKNGNKRLAGMVEFPVAP